MNERQKDQATAERLRRENLERTTETKVEAVAYLTHDDPITTIRRIVTADDFDTPEDMHLIARVNGWDPIYPASAITALEGERDAAERRVAELESALKGLLDDTQHKDHNCGDEEWCPVIHARAALTKESP